MIEVSSKFFLIRTRFINTNLSYHLSLEYRNWTFTEMVWTLFGNDFSLDFYFQPTHSIEKIVLFRSVQGRGGWLVPFRSYRVGHKEHPIKDSNISARCRPKELKFLPEIEAYFKFFFHRKNMEKSLFLCSKTDINKNFHLFWTLPKCY